MKPLLTKHQVKFLVGLTLYALILLLISTFKDPCWIIGALILLGAVTFGFALSAWLKSRAVITVLLVLGLATAPVRADASEQGQKNALLYVCCVVVVGAVIIYATYKICKAMKTIKKNLTNLQTNDVIQVDGPPLTNSPNAALRMPDWPIANNLTDDWQQVSLTLQSSANSQSWRDEYCMTMWMGSNTVYAVVYSNSIPLQTNMSPVYWTNDPVYLNFSAVMPTNATEPVKMWRAVER